MSDLEFVGENEKRCGTCGWIGPKAQLCPTCHRHPHTPEKDTMGVTAEMIEKVHTGDPISDVELRLMLKFYRKIEPMLEIMGREHGLTLKEVRRIRMMLEDFQTARRR